MEEIVFCFSCGKVINIDYHYCPYCGVPSKESTPFNNIVNAAMEKVSVCSKSIELKRLERLHAALKELEAELDLFLC